MLGLGCLGEAGEGAPDRFPDAEVADAGEVADGGVIAVTDAGFDAGFDAGIKPSDAGMVGGYPVFIAQGSMGRTMISCDDGQSWIHSQSQDDAFRCGDCDHNAYAATGLAAADGWVYTGWGHGAPGSVKRSRDGVNWEVAKAGIEMTALAAGGQAVVTAPWWGIGGAIPWRSKNEGVSWDQPATMMINPPSRRIVFVPRGEHGRFVIAAGDASSGPFVAYSDDQGSSWTQAASIEAGCMPDRVVVGKGVLLMTGGSDVGCRSLDDGQTWTRVPGNVHGAYEYPLFTGTKFITWQYTVGTFESADGLTWTRVGAGPNMAAAAVSDKGTYVASMDQYEKQVFLRSTDGVNWTPLADGKFAKGHPIRRMVFARLAENPCP
jgi:hypothetical protein